MSPARPTIALLALTLATACVMQTWHLASVPDQSVPISGPDVSRIYVMRADNTAGNLRRMIVFDDEMQIGSINEDEFVCWERAPGLSRLSVFYERPKDEGGQLQKVFELETAAGEVSFYGIVLDDERTELSLARFEPELGRAMVAERYVPQEL